MSEEKLKEKIQSANLASYPRQSRIHPLPSFGKKVFVKREDELGFGISGSKIRKYSSLIPYLIAEKADEVIVCGGNYSNHILGMSQLLRENKIRPVLFLIGEPPQKIVGNFLLTSLIVPLSDMHWISRDRWSQVEMITAEYVQKRAQENVKSLYIPMGGSCSASIAGLMTLTLDILRNEKEMHVQFDHLFIDAGTGMTAAVLVLALAWLHRSAHVHIIHLTSKEEDFAALLNRMQKEFEAFIGESLSFSLSFTLYQPENGRAFGSVNQKVLRQIAEMAREEGILTDPIYTAKLFAEGRAIMEKKKLDGNVLFIHSGGGLSLMGYQDELLATLEDG